MIAVFGINSPGLSLVINMLILALVIIYLALVYWTYIDATRRIEDPMLVACAAGAALFPFIGAIVYAIVRPPEFLEDVRERELEIAANEARLQGPGSQLGCPHCGEAIEKDFLRCPSCLRKLKEPCTVCHRPLDPSWRLCPYCQETELTIPSVTTPRRRRRATAGEQSPYD